MVKTVLVALFLCYDKGLAFEASAYKPTIPAVLETLELLRAVPQRIQHSLIMHGLAITQLT